MRALPFRRTAFLCSVFLSGLFPSTLSLAQEGPQQAPGSRAESQTYSVQRYRVQQVISATADVRDLAEVDGRVLAATDGGLLVFEGGRLRRTLIEGLPGLRLRSISEVADGLWVGGVEGAVLLDPSDLSILRTLTLRRVRRAVEFGGATFFASQESGLHRMSEGSPPTAITLGRNLAYRRVTDLLVHGDELWVSTSGLGILRVNAAGRVIGRIRRRHGLADEIVWRMLPDGENVLALTVNGVSEIAPNLSINRRGAVARASRRLPVTDVRSFARVGQDLYFGTFGAGLQRARAGARPRQVAALNPVHTLMLASNTELWVGHGGGMGALVARDSTNTGSPTNAGRLTYRSRLASGLPNSDLTSLARAFGSLWVGTFGQGLARIDGTGAELVARAVNTERWGMDRRINHLARTGSGADERLWIATDRGLYWHDGRIFSPIEDPQGPGSIHITSLYVAQDGALWVTSGRQLCRYEDGVWSAWSGDPSFPVAQLHAVVSDAQGRIWVGSLHGLYGFNPVAGRFTRYRVASGALAVDWVTAIVPWAEGIMAGTYHGGLSVGDGDAFTLIGENQGLPSGWVNPHAMSVIDDEAFIGTLERGLTWGQPGDWHSMGLEEGLPSEDVTDILAEGDQIWVATRGGLAQLSRSR